MGGREEECSYGGRGDVMVWSALVRPIECSDCGAAISQETRRPFANLCFVCALAVYIERLASFALEPPKRDDWIRFV